ncbi:hypothetical protein ACJMK2_010437 [Sinanodonta woodiana]|uniref:RGS domain-containing protein n=1 Tax=Sinanodonta woodiana TaxID=1069815 RepID=A0ABD3VGY3_SINWO
MIRQKITDVDSIESHEENISETSTHSCVGKQFSEDWTHQTESEQNVTAQSSSAVSLYFSKPTVPSRPSSSLTSLGRSRASDSITERLYNTTKDTSSLLEISTRETRHINLPKRIEKSKSDQCYQFPRPVHLLTNASVSLPDLYGRRAVRVPTNEIDQLVGKLNRTTDNEENIVKNKKPAKLLPPLRPPPFIPTTPEPPRQELEQFIIRLENKTFVDYFNVFLSLPVFGQHVCYNYLKRTFELEPAVKERTNIFVDKHEFLCWLYTERYKLFQSSALYCEYLMAEELKTATIHVTGISDNDAVTANTSNLSRNLFGSVIGIQLFRQFLKGTCGENVFSCWREIEKWRHFEYNDPEKAHLKNRIKMTYISDTAKEFISKRSKVLIFQGSLNDELLPDEEILVDILEAIGFETKRLMLETDQSFLYFQKLLLLALKLYWVKRYVLHLELTTPFALMKTLSRRSAGEDANEIRERMLRSRVMFPSVYEKEVIDTSLRSTIITGSISSSSTSVDVSTTERDSSGWSNGHVTRNGVESDLGEEETVHISPKNLFSLWAGPSKNIKLISAYNTPITQCEDDTSTVYNDSEEDVGMWHTLTSPRLAETAIPSTIRSFMTGKTTYTFMFQGNYYRISWSLASDILAGSPFQKFLTESGNSQGLRYLQLWKDLRDYSNADEHCINICGESCRKVLSNKIAGSYLSGSERNNLFSERLRESLLRDLSKNNDSPLIFSAQGIAVQALWEPMKMYIKSERSSFVNRVQANHLFVPYKRKVKMQAGLSVDHPTYDSFDPMYSFTMTNRLNGSPSDNNPSDNESFMPPQKQSLFQNEVSSPTDEWKSEMLEAQLWRAMELSILCTEHGNCQTLTHTVFKLDDLLDSLQEYYGSLHIRKTETVRKPWLRDLVVKPKIDIKSLRVSTKLIDETPLRHCMSIEEERFRRGDRYNLRREGVFMERPPKPKSLQDLLSSSIQYDFFKRFLIDNNALTPLNFWRNIEDLKQLSHIKTIQMKIKQIVKKYFSRHGRIVMLDCDDDIIWQIPVLEKVTPAVLVVAQNAVLRSLEKKWYCAYLETFPRDESLVSKLFLEDPEKVETVKDIVNLLPALKSKRQIEGKQNRVIQTWRWFMHNLCEFQRSISDTEKLIKLETYLECESDHAQKPELKLGRRNTPTRVVWRNRVIILARLPQDLWFYVEILKYMSLVDNVYATLCVTHEDTSILVDKAKSVIICFLNSEFPPKVQVNIPSEMAYVITSNLEYVGPTRALFHEALLLLFPLLYHYWKKFKKDESEKLLPLEYYHRLKKKLQGRSAHTPHQNITIPNYLNIKVENIPAVTMPLLEEKMKITFSFLEGVRYVYSLSRSRQGSKEEKPLRSVSSIQTSCESFNVQLPTSDEDRNDFKEQYLQKRLSSKTNIQIKPSQSQSGKVQILVKQA